MAMNWMDPTRMRRDPGYAAVPGGTGALGAVPGGLTAASSGGVSVGTPTATPTTFDPSRPRQDPGYATAPTGTPTVAPVPPGATGLGARIKAAYTAASARAGRHLSWDDPTVLLIWQVLGGLTPDQARAASQQGAVYANQNGRLLSDAEVDQHVAEVKTRMPNPNDVGYGLGSAIQTAFQDTQAQYPGSPLAGDDPRLLAAVRQNPELAGITPEQLGQIVAAGRQFTGYTGQLAGAGLDTMIGTTLGRAPVPMPHQMDPAAFDAIHADPVKLGLWQGALQRRGWDVGTYERQHRAARPVGTAAPSSGAGTWGGAPTGVWG